MHDLKIAHLPSNFKDIHQRNSLSHWDQHNIQPLKKFSISENHFSQTNNRSPHESPPIIKKQLKAAALNVIQPQQREGIIIMNTALKADDSPNDHLYFGTTFFHHSKFPKSPSASFVDSVKKLTLPQQFSGKENNNNKSILKKSQPQITKLKIALDFQGTQKDRPRSVPCARKKVEFRPSVLVYVFDKLEGFHVRSESQDLTSEPKDRKRFLIRNTSPMKQKFLTIQNGLTTMIPPTSEVPPLLDISTSAVHLILPQGTKNQISNHRLFKNSLTDDDIYLKSYESSNRSYYPLSPTLNLKNNNTHIMNFRDSDNNLSDINIINGLNRNVINESNNIKQNISSKIFLSHSSLPSSPTLTSPTSPSITATISPYNYNNQRPQSSASSDNIRTSTTINNMNNVEFVFFEDENCRLWLRFALDLGSGISASDVLVKANLAGNKVRIVGTRSKNGTTQEFNERCTLPMEVDPYMVIARMDTNGKLFVEGLIVTSDNKKKLLVNGNQK